MLFIYLMGTRPMHRSEHKSLLESGLSDSANPFQANRTTLVLLL